MRKAVSILIRMLFIPIILLALFLLLFTVIEYRPKEKIELFSALLSDTIHVNESYSSLIWNIGYAGLGENMDFFYDGGERVRDTKENVSQNFQGISNFLALNDSINFILLQEVDQSSKRSYHTDQFYLLDTILSRHMGFMGLNYKVEFVPVPVSTPLGKVKTGVATYSDIDPIQTIRYGFSGNYFWPKRLFMLKRCFMVCKFHVNNGKFLSIINVHNSAYDDGSLKTQQLNLLNEYAQQQYKQGNYVLMGGDWNQCPDKFEPGYSQPFDTEDLSYLPAGFLSNWQRIYSDSIPSNRRVNIPYTKDETLTTLIDYYIASPNITVTELKPQDMNFKNSDHQPLIISFILD